MGIAKPRGMYSPVESMTVRRTGADGEEAGSNVQTATRSTATVDHVLDSSNYKRDDDDDESRDDGRGGPPPFVVTMTMTMPPPTGTALANEGLTFPRPRPEGRNRGLSSTTHHLLIAAGSIGATIILVMAILAIYTMRKRNLTFRQAVSHGRSRVTRRGGPPTPPKAETWDCKPTFDADYGLMIKNTLTRPQRAMSLQRSDSGSSQRPLMALQRRDSLNNRVPEQPGPKSTFLLESPISRNPSHRRNVSETPSSPPILPLQIQRRRSESSQHAHSIAETSELRYPEPPADRQLSALPPPPTFKQFLNNRPSASGRMNTTANAMVSRFSWTNSNAPQTPHDTARDTNSYLVGRDSFMTQRSSVPRFRTIDSWVDQQADRIEDQKLREQFRLTQSSTATTGTSDDENSSIPKVPEIPANMGNKGIPPSTPVTIPSNDVAKGAEPDVVARTERAEENPDELPPLSSQNLPGKNVKHERQDTHTTVKTASIFRAHPGTEVRFSTRSAVPSEILDMGRRPTVLS